MASIFGHDYKGRKNIPIFSFLTGYFPKAMVEVVKVCVAGNAQHNPESALTDIHWSRQKSTDQLNTAMRHMMDHATTGPIDPEPPEVLAVIGAENGGTYHLAKAIWRLAAELELTIEKRDAEKATAAVRRGVYATGEEGAPTIKQYMEFPHCSCKDRYFVSPEWGWLSSGALHAPTACDATRAHSLTDAGWVKLTP